MSEPAPSSDLLSPAAEAFAEYLERFEDGECEDFERFCAEHGELRPALQRIHEKWRTMYDAFAEYARPGAPDQPVAATMRRLEELAESTPPTGRYVERREIARGGMGSIVEVWDRDLRRTIAMKTLLGDADRPRILARFLDEAQVTGQLDHPGIVPVHELGLDASGRIYFTMPLIHGQDFDSAIDRVHDRGEGADVDDENKEWSASRALGVLVRVCEAMAYAHSKGVVHRDLKPANVMIGRFGEIHVMDWGLARVGDGTSQVHSHRVDAAQADESSALLTLAGDVVGTPAYMAPEQARGEIDCVGPHTDIYAVGAMLYQLLAGRAPYLAPESADSSHEILTRVRTGPPVALHRLCPGVSPELQTICERAMARSPERRYGDMLELAVDLRSFLEGRVVRAYETGTIARTRKWMKRNPWLAASTAIAVLSLLSGLFVSVILQGRAQESAENLAAQLTSSNIERGRLFGATGNLAQAEDLVWSEHLSGSDRSRTAWALWDVYAHEPCLATFRAHERDVRGVLSTPDGSSIVSACGVDGKIKIWDSTSLREAAEMDHGSPIMNLAMDGAGTRVAAAGRDGRISIWDLPNRSLVRELVQHEPGTIRALQFSPDGTLLASSADERIWIWSVATGESKMIGHHERHVNGLAFDPSGDILASTSADRTVRLWAVSGGREREHALATLLGHRGATGNVAFSADGGRLFSASSDRTIRIWDTATRRSLGFLQADVGPMVPSLDGATLYVAGYWRIDCWDIETRTIRRSFALTDISRSLHLDTGRQQLISGHDDGSIRVWDLRSDRSVRELAEHEGRVAAICDHEGRRVATGDSSGALRLWEPRSGRVVRLAGSKARIKTLCFSPDGELLVAGDMSGHLRILTCADGTVLHDIEDHDSSSLRSAVFSPDGDTLAMAAKRGRIRLIDPRSGRVTGQWQVDTNQVLNLAFRPDGLVLASTGRSKYVRFWSRTGTLLQEHASPGSPWSLTFSPDGKKLAYGAWAGTIYVLDAESGRIEKRLTGHSGAVWSVAFSPGNPGLLASISADQTARLWDVRTGQNVATLHGCDLAVSFSADGRMLATGGFDQRVKVWDLDYFNRHVAGNLKYQLSRFDGRVGDVEALERERRRILGRPWPRWPR